MTKEEFASTVGWQGTCHSERAVLIERFRAAVQVAAGIEARVKLSELFPPNRVAERALAVVDAIIEAL